MAAVETLQRREPYLTPKIMELVSESYVRQAGQVGLVNISVKTVESYRTNVMCKPRLRSVSELVVIDEEVVH